MHPVWLRARLEELAGDLGRYRRITDQPDWRLEKICERVWWLLAAITPSAADLYKQTGDLDTALATAQKETHKLDRLLGA